MKDYKDLDTMSTWLKEVEKSERYIGWKGDKLYNKNGELIYVKGKTIKEIDDRIKNLIQIIKAREIRLADFKDLEIKIKELKWVKELLSKRTCDNCVTHRWCNIENKIHYSGCGEWENNEKN